MISSKVQLNVTELNESQIHSNYSFRTQFSRWWPLLELFMIVFLISNSASCFLRNYSLHHHIVTSYCVFPCWCPSDRLYDRCLWSGDILKRLSTRYLIHLSARLDARTSLALGLICLEVLESRISVAVDSCKRVARDVKRTVKRLVKGRGLEGQLGYPVCYVSDRIRPVPLMNMPNDINLS